MTRSARLALGLVATTLLAAAASAQPLIIKEDGVYARMPERVEVAADGTMTVVTTDVGPIPEGGVTPRLPEAVEVWSVRTDGGRLRGCEKLEWRHESMEFPLAVWPSEDGYRITSGSLDDSVCAPRIKGDALPTIADASRSTVPEWSHWVQVLPEDPFVTAMRPQPSQRLDASIEIEPELNTIPPNREEDVLACIERVERRFEALLCDNPVNLTFAVQFDEEQLQLRMDTGQFIAAVGPYDSTRDLLAAGAMNDGEEQSEITFYESLPGEQALPIKLSGQPPSSIEIVRIPAGIAQTLGIAAAFPTPHARTVASSSSLWDFDPLDGVTNGNSDFERTLTHEIIHALGFFSSMDRTNPADGTVQILDLFRFDRSIVQGQFTQLQVGTVPRMLDTAIEASLAFAIGVPGVGTWMSRIADGAQASHWKASNLTGMNGQLLGIMDPFVAARGSIPGLPAGYLYPSDIAALDQIGWNIDRDNPPQPPGAPVPLTPEDVSPQSTTDDPIISGAPVVTWTPGAGATHHVVYVSESPAGQPPTLVHRSPVVTGATYTVPLEELEPATRYTWRVVAVNDWAFTQPQHLFAFVTFCEDTHGPPPPGCCFGNANGDQVVDFNDMSMVLENWGDQTFGDGDANCDGCVNFQDITEVVANWLSPCP